MNHGRLPAPAWHHCNRFPFHSTGPAVLAFLHRFDGIMLTFQIDGLNMFNHGGSLLLRIARGAFLPAHG